MFTSRSEFRISSRSDNADLRLTAMGREASVVSDERWTHFSETKAQIDELSQLLENTRYTSNQWSRMGFQTRVDTSYRSGLDMLCVEGINIDSLIPHITSPNGITYTSSSFDPEIKKRVTIEAQYAPYVKRQSLMAEKFRREERMLLPSNMDYSAVHGLSTEERQALERVRPENIGMLRRIEGITPSGAVRIMMYLRKGRLLAATEDEVREMASV